MSDTADWKQKYRESLNELDAQERRWRQIEQALRRLVGRLCAAGMGVNSSLDEDLAALAAANRRNASAEELEALAAALRTTIAAVDAVAPVFPAAAAARRQASWNAVNAILQCLKRARPQDPAVEPLLAQWAKASGDAELAAVLDGAADLIGAWCDAVERERMTSAAVLSEVTARLGEMTVHLSESHEASRAGFEDTARLDQSVMAQVRELSAEVGGATDLAALQSLVSTRLEFVTRRIAEFRTREEIRQKEHAGRAAHMHARIADLEREAKDLYRKLDHEKLGARVDPLTRVANRKCFDERFAEELARCAHADSAAAMLIWDIDDFKLINDRYGHRAGDRVLQTVAGCLLAGLRAEDFVARIGGEEFVVLLSGLSAAEAMRCADGLRTAVERLHFHFRGAPVRVTVSCGITQLRTGEAPEAAFDRADAALYRAKREGKNLCVAA